MHMPYKCIRRHTSPCKRAKDSHLRLRPPGPQRPSVPRYKAADSLANATRISVSLMPETMITDFQNALEEGKC